MEEKVYLYTYDPETGKYTGTKEAVLDEFNTRIKKSPSYKAEPNATFDIPEFIEGFIPVYKNGEWQQEALPTIEEIREAKKEELKDERDRIQELPIEYNGKSFDYNKESLQKLNEAKDALEGTEDKQIWICADNTLTYLTYNDIMAIKLLGKNRSNDAHIQYAKLRFIVDSLETEEEIKAVTFDTNTSEITFEV